MYDEAKRYGEALTMAFVRSRGVDARIVRIFNTYGPRSDPDDGRLVPNFITQALRGEPLTVYGDGAQTRSLCYVSDLVDGLIARWTATPPGQRDEPRQPGGAHDPRIRPDHHRAHRQRLRDRLHRAGCRRRPAAPPAGHLPRPGNARLGAARLPARRARAAPSTTSPPSSASNPRQLAESTLYVRRASVQSARLSRCQRF